MIQVRNGRKTEESRKQAGRIPETIRKKTRKKSGEKTETPWKIGKTRKIVLSRGIFRKSEGK